MNILSTIFLLNTSLLDHILFVLNKYFYHFSYIDKIYDPTSRKAISRWTLLLPSAGCSWAKTKGGGCHMCGFARGASSITNGKTLSSDNLLRYFKINANHVANNKPDNISIYNGGSFFNDLEICLDGQIKIFREISYHPTIKNVFVESRPEYINERHIKNLMELLGHKKLMVGIGLECESDEIRNNSINKGFSKEKYEMAVQTLKRLGVAVTTYVFIKPLFLSEKAAIEEAVETVKYAFSSGSDEVALEAAFVQKGTLMEKYYKMNKFSPPWLWSIIEVVKNTGHLGVVRLGGFSDFPEPVALPRNCPNCTEKIKSTFSDYKTNLDLDIFSLLKCDCKNEWEKIIR